MPFRFKLQFLWIFFYFLVLPSFPESIYLDKISIEGILEKEEENRYLSILSFTEKEVITEEMIRGAYKELFELEVFEDLKFYLKDIPLAQESENTTEYPSKELIIEYISLYRINSISFTGNSKYSSFYLKDEVFTKENQYFRPYLINESITKLKSYYRLEGYLNPNIQSRVEKNDELRTIDLTYHIQEGVEVYVGKISIHNNKAVVEDDLKKGIHNEEDKWYKKGVFDQQMIHVDKKAIEYNYHKEGYLDAKIIDTQYSYSWKNVKDKKIRYVDIDYSVEEGHLYYFGNIEIKGNRLFSEEELKSKFKRKEGHVFSQSVHDEDISTIRDLYQVNGFIFSSVTDIRSIENGNIVNYIIDIYESKQAHIEKIFVQGNTKTQPHVIRRQLLFREGELFDRYKIMRSMERLFNTKYFENVNPEPRSGSVEGLMNLIIRVEEKRTVQISGGGGYGFDRGLFVNAKLEDINLLGRGFTIGGEVEAGFNRQFLNVYFQDPFLMDYPLSYYSSISFDFYDLAFATGVKTSEGIDEESREPIVGSTGSTHFHIPTSGRHGDSQTSILYKNFQFSLNNQFIYNFLDFYYFGFGLRYSVEKEYWDNIGKITPSFDKVETQLETWNKNKDKFDRNLVNSAINSIIFSLSLEINTLDNYIFPSRGTKTKLSADFVTVDYQLIKWHLSSSYHFTPWWRLTFSFNFSLDTFSPLFKYPINYNTSSYYQFRFEELKGWSSASMVDAKKLVADNHPQYELDELLVLGNPWGQSRLKLSTEITIPIVPNIIAFIFYMEMGNIHSKHLFSTNSFLYLFDPKHHMYSFGPGLGLQLANFPIRFFFSWKTIYDMDQKKFVFFNHKTGSGGGYTPEFVFSFQGLL